MIFVWQFIIIKISFLNLVASFVRRHFARFTLFLPNYPSTLHTLQDRPPRNYYESQKKPRREYLILNSSGRKFVKWGPLRGLKSIWMQPRNPELWFLYAHAGWSAFLKSAIIRPYIIPRGFRPMSKHVYCVSLETQLYSEMCQLWIF